MSGVIVDVPIGGLHEKAVMRMNDRIVIDPRIQHGKPVIKGTRMPVYIILAELAGGMSHEYVKREYDLTEEYILAALQFAAELIEQEKHYPLQSTA